MVENKQNKTEASPHTDHENGLYETVLDTFLDRTRQSGSMMTHLLDDFSEDAHALKELSQDKVELFKAYVKRDLIDAAHYLSAGGRTIQDWLGFDVGLIESELLHNFSLAADQTTLELLKLKEQANLQTYRTGESVGIGTLECDACGAKLHFHGPSRIPPCGQCHRTEFHRALTKI
jgi:hypothetical protein